MVDIPQLIENTRSLNNTITTFLKQCSLNYDPIPTRRDNVVLLTVCGSYKLKTNDEETLKKIKNEWDYWIYLIEPHIKHNRDIHCNVSSIHQIINCGWRVHNSNLDELTSRINSMFEDVIGALEIELKYSSQENGIHLNTNSLVFKINTNSTQIVIYNLDQLYDNLIKIVSESELSETEKNEINGLLEAAKSEPRNVGRFKSISNWINDKASKVSPTLNVISSLMSIISSVI